MKRITLLSAFTIVSLLTGSIVWANYDQWSSFKKDEGVIQSQDGILTKIPSDQEKLEVVNSIDPALGIPLKELGSATPVNGEKYEEVKIKHVFSGNEAELTFDVAYRNGVPVLLSNNDRPYNVTVIPNSRESLIQYKDNLYFVDIENKMIRNALLEQVGRYDLKDSERKIADKKDENLGLVWGAYASINQDGTKMVYFSNRNAAFNDNLNGEMWIKDLKTGEEKTVRNWEHVLGWGTDNELILRTIRDSTINIESYNIESGQSLQIAENYISVGFSHPYLIYQQEPKMMIVYQVETKEKKVIESETINLIKVLEINKYSSEIQWAIGLNAPDRTKIDRNILVFDLLHGVIKEINPLKNTLIESVQWVDSSQFLVNAREIGSSQNSTYFVDNDKLWGDE